MPDPVQVDEEIGQWLKDSWINRRLPVIGLPITIYQPTLDDLIGFLELMKTVARTSVTIVPSDPPTPPPPLEP